MHHDDFEKVQQSIYFAIQVSLIDKKVKDGYQHPKIFIVHYRFDPSLFKGTLFETELKMLPIDYCSDFKNDND